MSTDDLLQQGIAAARSEDFTRARELLSQAVRANPRSELAWQWLGYSIDEPEKQAECFRRVLQINPGNAYARQQLEAMHRLGVMPVQPAHRRKKKNNPLTYIILAGAALACLCMVGGVVLWMNGGLSQSGALVTLPQAAPPPEAVLTLPPAAIPTQNYTPVYGQMPCTFEAPEGAKVECGVVVVPENRAGDPQDTIRLATVIYHSASPNPAPDPIIFLPGGPGMAGIPWTVAAYQEQIAPLVAERDFIAFDPRGTGSTIPVLDCKELQTTNLRELEGLIPADQRQSYYGGALQVCQRKLSETGIDLNAYTSSAYAADVRDILTALGYRQANLYATSYGTRVAQIVLREYPQIVRSAVLDSVVPLESKIFENLDANANRSLETLFAACAADAACTAAYPNLKSKYQAARQALDERPLRTTTFGIPEEGVLNVLVSGQTFADTITWMLRNGETIPIIPQIITRTYAKNYDPLRLLLSLPYNALSEINLGAYVSVSCHEQVYTAAAGSVGLIVDETCALWGSSAPAPGENEPVSSDLPVLLISGRFDPATPPTYASQVAGHLGRASLLEFPVQGHVPTGSSVSNCACQAMADFIRNPSAPVQPACLAGEQKVQFALPYTGTPPAGLEDVEVAAYNLVSRVPAGWEEVEAGVFARQNSLNDIVQIGVQQGPATKERILDNLRSGFNNGAGFKDRAALESTQKINDLEWSLYKAESSSILIDMAFAVSGKQTLMVILVSFPDEREALYRTIFLPAVEATRPLK